MCSAMAAGPSPLAGVRREPFVSLDLPEWARMTEMELDELSDSDDFSDDELCDEDPEPYPGNPHPIFGNSPSPRCMWRGPGAPLDESDLNEIPITPSPQMFSISPGCPLHADEVEVVEPLAAHLWQTPKVRCRMGSSTSPASTACPSPDACQRACWADLEDSDDEAAKLSDWSAPIPGSRWADLVDDSDEEDGGLAAKVRARPLLAARWADLLDSEDEA